jgi:hypothetical protein
MATNLAVSTNFGSLSTYVYPTGYDPTKLGLGPLMMQANDAGNEGKWVGPTPTNVARPFENGLALSMKFPDAINITSASNNNRYDWILVTEITVGAATRKFELFQFDRQARVNPWSSFGAITATPPGGNTYVVTSLALSYAQYTSANNSAAPSTVAINNGSTTLTGTSASWTTDRIFVGSRIGIGTTDPALVTTWYTISAVSVDNTTLTLQQAYQGVNCTGQPYIIEDLRILFTATATTTSNAGLYMVAGLSLADFSNAATVIPAATNVDKIKATYWLSDGFATNNANCQAYGGIVLDTRTTWISQLAYCCNMPALSSQFQVNNFRAAMTLGGTTSGRDAAGPGAGSTWLYNTGQQAVTGAVSQTHNLTLCTPGAGGGPRSGQKTLFWVTVSRIYSAVVSNIVSASVTFQSGAMVEIPPGSTTTFAATGALASIAYDSLADRFLVLSSGATSLRSYYTMYREDAGQMDRIILADMKQINQSIMDATAAIYPVTSLLPVTATCKNGMTYLITTGTALATNDFLYNIPYAADWEYSGLSASGLGTTTNCCVVTPAMSTSQFASFIAGYFNQVGVLGGPTNPTLGRTGTNLGMEPGAVRMYYRTNIGSAGVVDNGGTWNLLDYSGLMSLPPSSQVQARLEFRICNTSILPRVTRVCFEGAGSVSTNNFQFSQSLTVLASKQFAFRQSAAFGVTTPLFMRIYDAVTNALLVSDSTASSTGKWEYSTNSGGAWTVFASLGSGATVTFTAAGGTITVVDASPVAGGSGYPASATINLVVGGGVYGIVQGTTDGSGIITSFSTTPIAGGTGYTSAVGASTSSACPWHVNWEFANQTTYLRYTPYSIADNIDAMPVLSVS